MTNSPSPLSSSESLTSNERQLEIDARIKTIYYSIMNNIRPATVSAWERVQVIGVNALNTNISSKPNEDPTNSSSTSVHQVNRQYPAQLVGGAVTEETQRQQRITYAQEGIKEA